MVTDLDPDFERQGAVWCDRFPAMAGLFLVRRDAKGCEIDARSCKTIVTAARRGTGKYCGRGTTSGGRGEKLGGGGEGEAVPEARIGVTEREAVRVGGTKRGFKQPPARGAERVAVAATKHLAFCEFEWVDIATTKRLKQLVKCEAKPLSYSWIADQRDAH